MIAAALWLVLHPLPQVGELLPQALHLLRLLFELRPHVLSSNRIKAAEVGLYRMQSVAQFGDRAGVFGFQPA